MTKQHIALTCRNCFHMLTEERSHRRKIFFAQKHQRAVFPLTTDGRTNKQRQAVKEIFVADARNFCVGLLKLESPRRSIRAAKNTARERMALVENKE